MNKQKIKHFIFSVIIVFLVLFVLNALSMFIARDKYLKLDLVDRTNYFKSYGWFVPSQEKQMLFPGLPQGYHLTINDLGLRDTGVQVDLDRLKKYKKRILCVGDSVTFGLFGDDEDSYPYLLEDKIRAEGKSAVVLNAGVGSTTIRDHLDYIKQRGIQLQPDIVILNFCSNDLADLKRERPYYTELTQNPKKGFERILKETALYRSILSFYVNLKYKRWISKAKDEKVRDILTHHPQDIESSLYVSEHYHTPDVVFNPYSDELKDSWNEYFDFVKQTSDYLKERGIKLIFVIHPELMSVFDKTDGRFEDLLKKFFKENDIDYVDIMPVLKKDRKHILSYFNNPPRDFHPGRKGYSLFVDGIYDLIKDQLKE